MSAPLDPGAAGQHTRQRTRRAPGRRPVVGARAGGGRGGACFGRTGEQGAAEGRGGASRGRTDAEANKEMEGA
eukprot:6195567-Pleurochrysis_carterae.AAC.2